MIGAEETRIEQFSKHWRTAMTSTVVSKIDLKRDLKPLYTPPSKDFVVVEVPPMAYLMIDGHGDPNTSQDYRDAIEALYSVSYTMKFAEKGHRAVDWVVMPLEGLWWADDMEAFTLGQKQTWQWTAMIAQPDVVTRTMILDAVAEAARKKQLPALSKLYFETYREGLCAQILHLGPFSAEGPTIERLHREWLPAHGYAAAGKHHEIYLSDPRRTAPEALKTIIRQPVRKV